MEKDTTKVSEEIFTPRTRDGVRQSWKQSGKQLGYSDRRGYGYKGDFILTKSNKDGSVFMRNVYRIYGAACDLGSSCCCDAVALHENDDADLISAIEEAIDLGMVPEDSE